MPSFWVQKYKTMLRYLLLITISCSPFFLSAQFNAYTELGVVGGFMSYSGDISERRVEIGETKIGLGLFARHTFSNNFAVKGMVYYGELSGDDVNAPTEGLQNRKFRFSAPVVETSALMEFSFLSNERSLAGRLHGSPYFFAGFGITYADPTASYYGPDAADPTKNPFPEPEPQSIFFTIPVGMGAKVYLDERIGLNAEFGWRPVFSDKLDGVSLSANPNKKDWYIVMNLGLTYIFTK